MGSVPVRTAPLMSGSADCNLAPHGGFPAMSVPMGFTSEGLAVGLELTGRPFEEETQIAVAAGYEAHTNHQLLPPTTPPLRACHSAVRTRWVPLPRKLKSIATTAPIAV